MQECRSEAGSVTNIHHRIPLKSGNDLEIPMTTYFAVCNEQDFDKKQLDLIIKPRERF